MDNNDYLYGSDWAEREAQPAQEPPAPPVQPPPYTYTQGFPPPYSPYYPPPQPAYASPPAQGNAKPKGKRTGLVLFSVFTALAVVVGVFVGLGVYRNRNPESPVRPESSQQGGAAADDSRLEIAETPAQADAPDGTLSSVEVAKKLRDSNVAVQLYSGRSDSVVGEGSGILLHEDNSKTWTYVLTCAHVINGKERISVELADGTSYDATVVGFDNRTDVGLLRVKATDYEGMGFAIPSKVVQSVVNNLIAKGYVPDRPKLGIQYIAASRTQRGMLVMRINDLPSGSLIIAVIDEDSDIAGTDVRANDIITHVNGEPLNKAAVLLTLIEKGKVGQELTLTIARVNSSNYSVESFDVKVKLVEDKGAAAPAQEETRPWYEDDDQGFGGFPGFPWDW